MVIMFIALGSILVAVLVVISVIYKAQTRGTPQKAPRATGDQQLHSHNREAGTPRSGMIITK